MSLAQCAALLQKGDFDRYLAVMAAPLPAREPLLVLYAFNLEVARAPWASTQSMINEMRLQFWRDVVEEAQAGAKPKAHEVAGVLHQLIVEKNLPLKVLDDLIAARRHDAWGEPFEDQIAFEAYIEDTGAGLMWLAGLALDAPPEAEAAMRHYGWAAGLANYLLAVPALEARGRQALPNCSDSAVQALAKQGLERLAKARALRRSIPKGVRPALLAGWQSEAILRRALEVPQAMHEGSLRPSEFSRRGRLLWQATTGRW